MVGRTLPGVISNVTEPLESILRGALLRGQWEGFTHARTTVVRTLSIVITQGISVILIFAQLFRWITSWSVVSDLFTERV